MTPEEDSELEHRLRAMAPGPLSGREFAAEVASRLPAPRKTNLGWILAAGAAAGIALAYFDGGRVAELSALAGSASSALMSTAGLIAIATATLVWAWSALRA